MRFILLSLALCRIGLGNLIVVDRGQSKKHNAARRAVPSPSCVSTVVTTVHPRPTTVTVTVTTTASNTTTSTSLPPVQSVKRGVAIAVLGERALAPVSSALLSSATISNSPLATAPTSSSALPVVPSSSLCSTTTITTTLPTSTVTTTTTIATPPVSTATPPTTTSTSPNHATILTTSPTTKPTTSTSSTPSTRIITTTSPTSSSTSTAVTTSTSPSATPTNPCSGAVCGNYTSYPCASSPLGSCLCGLDPSGNSFCFENNYCSAETDCTTNAGCNNATSGVSGYKCVMKSCCQVGKCVRVATDSTCQNTKSARFIFSPLNNNPSIKNKREDRNGREKRDVKGEKRDVKGEKRGGACSNAHPDDCH
ncbi:hypothetical protein QBC46DRAFT_341496 [Diplogelasinospora grovesii]|uniref:Uncharacterized protein n=1 Tax=Diplogelasinospora grovesii TaxID=303347 RepID=A0AAN6S4T6_9PEZI|nr:hypothetical protein QBC46DRAFT_341496 [Diplogelasinospora grovesii]